METKPLDMNPSNRDDLDLDLDLTSGVLADNIESDYQPFSVQDNKLSSLDESFENFNSATIEAQDISGQLLKKLLPVVNNFKLDVSVETDPELYMAQAKMIDQVRQLVNDSRKAAAEHTKTMLQAQAIKDQKEANFNMAEVLRNIKLNSAAWAANDPNHPVFANEKELEDTLNRITKDEVISDGELEIAPGKLPRPDGKEANDPFKE